MNIKHQIDLQLTRQQFFNYSTQNININTLTSLLGPNLTAFTSNIDQIQNPQTNELINIPHFAPKTKQIIFLHQSNGPSQLKTFNYKPGLTQYQKTQIPNSIQQNQHIAQTIKQSSLLITKSSIKFAQHENSDTWISELLPYTTKIINDITIIKTMNTKTINHDPTITFIQTGFQQPKHPNMST